MMSRLLTLIPHREAWHCCHASIAFVLSAVLALGLAACSTKDKNPVPEDAIVSIGNKYLTLTDIKRQLPGGLTAEDSARFTDALINSWIYTQLISQVAAKEIDMDGINSLVDQYRNELIMLEYSRRMFDTRGKSEIPEDSIQKYYDEHAQEFKLERPMVKGVYLKVADDAPSLPKLRKLYRSQKENDIDNLDKSELNGAVHYDYFRDQWIDWEQIENKIPYDFGANPDVFLRSNRGLDYSHGGFTYLLDITDVVFSGQTRPFESARQQIIDRLEFYNRRSYDEALRQSLFDKAESQGKIRFYRDTPTTD
ncbi:MAG: peptidyl-prolyl cis-trans isomerase [Bacteroidales bacterium]|nr:peptidyl-prolyl cis-trans isomerase [Bacteroidales bacterium]